MKRTFLKIAATLLIVVSYAGAQGQSWTGPKEKPKTRIDLKYGPLNPGKRTDADMQRFREYGLGQFIHWGVYAIAGGMEWRKGAYCFRMDKSMVGQYRTSQLATDLR